MDANEHLLIIAGIAVVVGVCMEGWTHGEDIKTKGWRPLTPKIGFGILVLGLFAETYAEIRIGQADTQFRVAALHDLRDSADKLREESEKARDEEDRLDASNLIVGNIFLPRRVAVSLGPNGPSGEEFAKLTKFPGTKIEILSVPDLEAVRLSADICGALKLAKWDAAVSILPLAQSFSLVGVHIAVTGLPVGTHQMSNIDDPVWQLSEYLRSGYLRDLDMRSTAGIETDFFYRHNRRQNTPAMVADRI